MPFPLQGYFSGVVPDPSPNLLLAGSESPSHTFHARGGGERSADVFITSGHVPSKSSEFPFLIKREG